MNYTLGANLYGNVGVFGVVGPVAPVEPVAPDAPFALFGVPFRLLPKLLADCEDIPPPVMLTPCFSSSMRGSYQNSHIS